MMAYLFTFIKNYFLFLLYFTESLLYFKVSKLELTLPMKPPSASRVGLGVVGRSVPCLCVSVSTCVHEFLHLCAQEASWGGQSLRRHDGLPLGGPPFLSLCLFWYPGRALAGQGSEQAREWQLGSQGGNSGA